MRRRYEQAFETAPAWVLERFLVMARPAQRSRRVVILAQPMLIVLAALAMVYGPALFAAAWLRQPPVV